MKTDVYMFPCINDSKITAEKQVDDMIDNLAKSSTKSLSASNFKDYFFEMLGSSLNATTNGDSYGTIWVDVETNPSSTCTWDNITSVADRCTYL